jgi:hypothetical protein
MPRSGTRRGCREPLSMSIAGTGERSRSTCSSPDAFRCMSMVRATMSRGASEPRRVHALHQRRAVQSRRTAPSPRTASEMRNARSVGWIQCGRMELDELEVGHGDARTERHGDAVAGRDVGVGRVPIRLTEAARGQQHECRPELDEPDRCDARGAAPRQRARPSARAPTVRGRWPAGPRPDGCAGAPPTACEQCALDLATRQVAGVHDAAARMPALPAQRQDLGPGEPHAPVHQVADPRGSLADQRFDRAQVAQAGAGDERVAHVQVGGIIGAITAAMPPCA